MEVPKAIVAVSSHRNDLAPQETESQISSLLYGRYLQPGFFRCVVSESYLLYDFYPECMYRMTAHKYPVPIINTMLELPPHDVSQQVRDAMQNMLKMTAEIDQSSGDVVEEIEKCKESASAKSKILEEERDRYQKAAMAVLQMLNGTDDIP